MHTLSNGRTSVAARPLSHGLRRASSPKGGAKIGPACHCEERSDVAIRFCSKRSKPSHIGSPEQAALSLYNGLGAGQTVRLMGHLPPGKWKQSRAKAVENTVESGGKLKLGFKKERKNGVSTAMGKFFLKNLFQVFCAKIRCFHKNCAD